MLTKLTLALRKHQWGTAKGSQVGKGAPHLWCNSNHFQFDITFVIFENYYFIFNYILISLSWVHLRLYTHVTALVWRSEVTCRSQFFPSITWVLGTNPKLPAFIASIFTPWTIMPVLPLFFFKWLKPTCLFYHSHSSHTLVVMSWCLSLAFSTLQLMR